MKSHPPILLLVNVCERMSHLNLRHIDIHRHHVTASSPDRETEPENTRTYIFQRIYLDRIDTETVQQ